MRTPGNPGSTHVADGLTRRNDPPVQVPTWVPPKRYRVHPSHGRPSCTCESAAASAHGFGGLGRPCAAVLMEAGIPARFRIVGIPDEYTAAGSQPEILRHYGITGQGLARVGTMLV